CFPVDIGKGFIGTQNSKQNEQTTADQCDPMAGGFFTCDHDVGEHEDKQCEKHGYLISRIAKVVCMKFIVWNRADVTITPMENIEQTTCFHIHVWVMCSYPN